MPGINTNPSPSDTEAATSSPTKSPYSLVPYSPDSYSLPKSITSPSHPDSSLLPTNSPTFLVAPAAAGIRPAFKVPTSPAHTETRAGIVNSFVNAECGLEGHAVAKEDEDENEGLIMFPSYHDSANGARKTEQHPCDLDVELLPAEEDCTDDSYSEASTTSSTETETDSNASSSSSSPSLSSTDFDYDCEAYTPIHTPSLSSTPEPTTPFLYAEDDLSLSLSSSPHQPAHYCVDFLAHDWQMGDLLASWRHVRAHRQDIRASERLENALLRVWWREERGLVRVDPEVIHWAKDIDNTWLYGPFAPCPTSTTSLLSSPQLPCQAPNNTSPSAKSPTASLLKHRDPAREMTERSQYTFSLLCEATGFRIPCRVSPVPSPIPSPSLRGAANVPRAGLGLDLGEKKGKGKKRVVFDEVVIVYRETVPVSEDLNEYEDGEFFEHFGGF